MRHILIKIAPEPDTEWALQSPDARRNRAIVERVDELELAGIDRSRMALQGLKTDQTLMLLVDGSADTAVSYERDVYASLKH